MGYEFTVPPLANINVKKCMGRYAQWSGEGTRQKKGVNYRQKQTKVDAKTRRVTARKTGKLPHLQHTLTKAKLTFFLEPTLKTTSALLQHLTWFHPTRISNPDCYKRVTKMFFQNIKSGHKRLNFFTSKFQCMGHKA